MCLVNARHVKGVPGNKTDVRMPQWLQQLHAAGLLRKSFRPAQEIVPLRYLMRHRQGPGRGPLRSRCSHAEGAHGNEPANSSTSSATWTESAPRPSSPPSSPASAMRTNSPRCATAAAAAAAEQDHRRTRGRLPRGSTSLCCGSARQRWQQLCADHRRMRRRRSPAHRRHCGGRPRAAAARGHPRASAGGKEQPADARL